MTISEVVSRLEQLKNEYGDLPVYFWNEWLDFEVERVEYFPTDDIDPKDDLHRPDRIIIDDGTSA